MFASDVLWSICSHGHLHVVDLTLRGAFVLMSLFWLGFALGRERKTAAIQISNAPPKPDAIVDIHANDPPIPGEYFQYRPETLHTFAGRKALLRYQISRSMIERRVNPPAVFPHMSLAVALAKQRAAEAIKAREEHHGFYD